MNCPRCHNRTEPVLYPHSIKPERFDRCLTCGWQSNMATVQTAVIPKPVPVPVPDDDELDDDELPY